MNLKTISLRERKHAETKVALLKVFLKKLAEKSFEEISVKELCEDVLISDVTFFNYFPSKSDLLVYYIQIWSIEVQYHIEKELKDPGYLKEIEYIFEHTAKIIEENPNLMTEIIAYVTINFTKIRFGQISTAEKLIAFPELQDVEKVEPVNLNELFANRIKKAIEKKELPDNTDIEGLTFSLISIFFGTPIGWTKLDPKKVSLLYKHNLEILWKGARLNLQ